MIGAASNILSGLGDAESAVGRIFAAGEDQPGRGQVVILSHHFGQQELGGRAGVLGQQNLLDNKPYQVIGIMPPAFPFPRGCSFPISCSFPIISIIGFRWCSAKATWQARS